MPCDALALYSYPRSVNWCLAEGYRNGDQRRHMGPCGLRRTLLYLLPDAVEVYQHTQTL